MRNVTEVKVPLVERKTEFYAIPDNGDNHNYQEVVGPCTSIRELESSLDPGTWVIATKLKKVVVGA